MTEKVIAVIHAALEYLQGGSSRGESTSPSGPSKSFHVTNGPRHQQTLTRKESWNSKSSGESARQMHDLPLLQALKLQEANERLLQFETKKAQRY